MRQYRLSHSVPTVRPVACHFCAAQMPQGDRYATARYPGNDHAPTGFNWPVCSLCAAAARTHRLGDTIRVRASAILCSSAYTARVFKLFPDAAEHLYPTGLMVVAEDGSGELRFVDDFGTPMLPTGDHYEVAP